MENGRRLLVGVQNSEKLNQDFELTVTNKGAAQLDARARQRDLSPN